MSDEIRRPADLFSLEGRRAVVIGGTGVLGSRFARCLAAAGAQTFVLGRSVERGEATRDRIVSEGGAAEFVPVDVEHRGSVRSAADRIGESGGVDVLVLAPGVNSAVPFAELDDEQWRAILAVNLDSVFIAAQEFRPLMTDRPEGASLITISSASSGPPLSRVLPYGVAKAGVNNLTQYLARELAPDGIRVNAILPGFFPAEQNRALLTQQRREAIIGHTPLARLGTPDELDGVLLWLASGRASSFVTGALIRVDGGFSAMTI